MDILRYKCMDLARGNLQCLLFLLIAVTWPMHLSRTVSSGHPCVYNLTQQSCSNSVPLPAREKLWERADRHQASHDSSRLRKRLARTKSPKRSSKMWEKSRFLRIFTSSSPRTHTHTALNNRELSTGNLEQKPVWWDYKREAALVENWELHTYRQYPLKLLSL